MMIEKDIERIKVGKPIPREVANHIKTFVSESDYYKVSDLHKGIIKGGTVKHLIYYKNKVSELNIEPVKTLCRLAIQYSQSYRYSREVIINFLGEDECEALQKLNEQAA